MADFHSETAMLRSVNENIRTKLDLNERQCDIEFDDEVPAIAGDLYVAVQPAGRFPHPTHKTSGGVSYEVIQVAVTVILRLQRVPRDRQRNVFIDNLTGLNAVVGDIVEAIDFQYGPMHDANQYLAREVGYSSSTYRAWGFITPLVLSGVDAKPQIVSGDIFSSGGQRGEPRAGLKRTINFGGAERIQTRIQT